MNDKPNGKVILEPAETPSQAVQAAAINAMIKLPVVYVNNVSVFDMDGGWSRIVLSENVLGPHIPEPRVAVIVESGAVEAFGKAFLEYVAQRPARDAIRAQAAEQADEAPPHEQMQ